MIGKILKDSLSLCRELRAVRGDRITATLIISLKGSVLIFEDHRRVIYACGTELICKIEFSRRSTLHTDIRALQCVETRSRITHNILFHHDGLTIIKSNRTEGESKFCITIVGPGTVSAEHIHFTRLQGCEAFLCAQTTEFNSIGIIEEGRSPSAAEIHIKAGPVACAIYKTKPLEGSVYPTDDLAAIQYGLQTFAACNWSWSSGWCFTTSSRCRGRCFHTRGRSLSCHDTGDFHGNRRGSNWRSTGCKHEACKHNQTEERGQLTHDFLLLLANLLFGKTN